MRMALGMVVAAAACIAHADELVTLHFYVRPPYMDQTEGAQVRGLTADPAQAAFEKAGIPFRWQQTPAKRQLVLIESGTGLDCGVGWYKTPEREQFGKFTAPLYRDKPTVAIAHMGFQPRSTNLTALAADPSVRIVTKVGLSYGQEVLGIMAGAKAQVQAVTTDQSNLARMVASGRADFMFSPQEEASTLIAEADPSGSKLRMLTFADLHAGATRHILCSKKVSDVTLGKLDAALSKLARSTKP